MPTRKSKEPIRNLKTKLDWTQAVYETLLGDAFPDELFPIDQTPEEQEKALKFLKQCLFESLNNLPPEKKLEIGISFQKMVDAFKDHQQDLDRLCEKFGSLKIIETATTEELLEFEKVLGYLQTNPHLAEKLPEIRPDSFHPHGDQLLQESLSSKEPQAELLPRFIVEHGPEKIYFQGVLITMRPKVYRLFHFLLRHPGKWLPYEEIMQSIWGTEMGIKDLQNLVSELRNMALKPLSNKHPGIHTKLVLNEGNGYRLDLEAQDICWK